MPSPTEVIKRVSMEACLPQATVRRVLSGLSRAFMKSMIAGEDFTMMRVGRFYLLKKQTKKQKDTDGKPLTGLRVRVGFRASQWTREKIKGSISDTGRGKV